MIIYTRHIKPISNSQYKKLKKKRKERKPIECIDTKEIAISYTKYLKTIHWHNLRTEKLLLNPICEKCQSAINLNLHHLTYTRLGKEKLSDLITLCQSCHTKLHREERKTKKLKRKVGRKSYLVGGKIKKMTLYKLLKLIETNKRNGIYVPIIAIQPNQINSFTCKTLEG
jgi:5-methylcytosine-specific restriction endonuclease McrA